MTLVVGELAPKRLAMQRAESWWLVAARPLILAAELAAPAIWVLSHATDLTVRALQSTHEPLATSRSHPPTAFRPTSPSAAG